MAIFDASVFSFEYANTVRANTQITTGKWYWEIIIERGLYWDSCLVCVGVGTGSVMATQAFANTLYGWGIDTMGRAIHAGLSYSQAVPAFRAATIQHNTTIGIAFDADNGDLWAIVADEWGRYDNIGNPVTGTNPHITGITSPVYPMVSIQFNSDNKFETPRIKGNFGKLIFKHERPSGFSLLIGPASSSSSSLSFSSSSQSSSSSSSISSSSTSSSSSISSSSSSWSSESVSSSSSSSKSSSSKSLAESSGTYHTSSDDGCWDDNGSVLSGETYIYLGTETPPDDWHAFFNFENLNIPDGATIISATLSFNVYYLWNTVSVTTYGLPPDDSLPPINSSEANGWLSGDVMGGSTISITSTGTASIDVVDEVQAIVDHEQYSYTDNIALIVESNNAYSNAICHVRTQEAGNPASLYVNWTNAY